MNHPVYTSIFHNSDTMLSNSSPIHLNITEFSVIMGISMYSGY